MRRPGGLVYAAALATLSRPRLGRVLAGTTRGTAVEAAAFHSVLSESPARGRE